MIVNFRTREISRDAHKLARTSTLILKKLVIYIKNLMSKYIKESRPHRSHQDRINQCNWSSHHHLMNDIQNVWLTNYQIK
jgi:hypothetical protein